MSKRKIFVSAYACEPGLGSEIGVGWHWVLEMSRYYELWVLTRLSNRHTIEPWIAEHPEYSHIHFLYFDLPKWARFWKKGLRGVRTYYNIWQTLANRIVRRTMKKNDIHIFHHLTYGNVLWKVSSYGQKQFFIWGPAGGVETIPEEYSRHYSLKMQLVEKVRRSVVSMLPFNIGFRRRCRNADLILCKTDILRNIIPAQYRSKAILFTDVAVDKDSSADQNQDINASKTGKVTEFLSVGRLDPWRGFDITIEAFAKAAVRKPDIHLTILGKGADKERLSSIISSLGLDGKVTLAGAVSMDEYKEYMRKCGAVINASLKEGAVTVSFDSMAMGKPLICIDTTGYTRYFSSEYSEIIPLGHRDETVSALADSIVKMTDADLRKSMGEKARTAGESFSWANRGREIYDAIEKALSDKK